MAKGKKSLKVVIKKRRRLECRTDYKARIALLSSGAPRLVVRKSNLYITAQIVKSKEAQDSVVCTATSRELEGYGWKGSKKNLPASYLTCFLLGKKCKDRVKKAVLDIGLHRSTKGSKIYACLKGAIDAGLEIPHAEEMLPGESRLKGEHINKELGKQFDDVKKKILESDIISKISKNNK